MTELERYFIFKCHKGLKERLKRVSYPVDEEVYKERLEYELKIIIEMGFAGYFLVVQDFINWAKRQGILVGPARGSAAGSLACWALGITGLPVDPLLHGLFFERFLNPHRISMPDIDVDFPKDRRDEVIQYVREKYGNEKVAQIGTFGTFKAKAAIKAVARTLGVDRKIADKLTKLYPKPLHGKEFKLKEAYTIVPELEAYRNSRTKEGEILRWAEKIEDRVASFGIHASGVVISNVPLYRHIPLAKGKRDEVVTQWDMNNVEQVGLIKFDFLGLKTLDQLSKTLEYIKQRHNIEIDLETIPLNDERTFANLRKGDNIGIFQLETSSGMRDLMVKQRPNSIADLAALVAMYRPGPLSSPKMTEYLAWRAGEQQPTYHHPDLRPILEETGGWIVYQEQVLQIARDLAGYSLAEADMLRRAVGKKKEKEMAEQYAKFRDGMLNKGYSSELADTLWEEIKAFADYGFNKSHAVAYGVISYWSAYLKTHYPVEFMAAALTCDSGNMDQMIVYLQECRRMGIEVLPPDANESEASFYPTGNNKIRFGFSAIKNLGTAPANHICEVRKLRPFLDFFDFCRRVDLGLINKTKLESLVLAGAFDFTGKNRATLLQAVDAVLQYKEQHKRYMSKLEAYEKKLEAYKQREEDIKNGVLSGKGKPLRPLKVPEKPEKPVAPRYIEVPEMSIQELLRHEKELTGFFISGHPLDNLHTQIKKTGITISSLRTEKPDWITLVGIISDLQVKESRNKKRMAFGRVEDLTGTAEMVVFPQVYAKYRDFLLKNTPILINAKVEYVEAETDEFSVEDEVIPQLLVNTIEPLEVSVDSEEIFIDVPLTVHNVEKVKKVADKYQGNEATVTIRFITQRGDFFVPSQQFRITNGKAFRTEIYREINN